MTALPSVTGKSLLTALRSAGFMVVRSKGSHHFLRQGVFLWREWQALETAQGWLPRLAALAGLLMLYSLLLFPRAARLIPGAY